MLNKPTTVDIAHRVTRLGDFLLIGLLFEAHYDFVKIWSRPKLMSIVWATFLLKHLHLNEDFKTWLVVGILRFQKWFGVNVLEPSNWALMLIFWHFRQLFEKWAFFKYYGPRDYTTVLPLYTLSFKEGNTSLSCLQKEWLNLLQKVIIGLTLGTGFHTSFSS